MSKKEFLIPLLLILIIFSALYLFWLYPKEKEPELPLPPVEELITLPPPIKEGVLSVEEAIFQRRSIREYTEEPLKLQDISQLMWAAQGITDPERGKRAAPSAGMTYPLEIYVVVGSGGVEGLEKGVYRYTPKNHTLTRTGVKDLRPQLARTALDQPWVREAPINIVITAVYERTTRRYGERGIRYVHLEAGHVGQNLHLQAESLGLGMVVVGAFRDKEVQEVLNLPADHQPLYIIPVGHPR